ncbi:hypothetical protein SAMD00019534_113820 [Acytostelium subglobosum LB1]|uniref:hypothetical protein n=1 Tax=Acytostelium subglobosum LB1 TaxID=1410327 RepID=UPI000644F5DA|nr:hypothetical protein SAMD00019534_113820 [Acytostelium subglobosum LB1]GAM28206.1 hypothetical protein SAMD00019534_113820 [Acytostelium subglobosum LB1]|eukprot:XP_012748840.1 hypothetical protein SAMD00019534_113820 [Acytostelium subglobosum LB1]
MIKLVHGIFTTTKHRLLFIQAIAFCAKRGDSQSIQFMIDVIREASGDTSLNLKDIDYDRLNETTDVDTLAVLADNGIIDSNTHQSRSNIVKILDNACNTGHVETIRFIDQRFNQNGPHPGGRMMLVPTYPAIEKAVMLNHHSVIKYLFDRKSIYWRSMELQQSHPLNAIRLLKQLQYYAFNNGHLNIINDCTKLINQLV